MARLPRPRQCWVGVIHPSELRVGHKNYILRIAGLCLLFSLLSSVATIPVLHALNAVSFSVNAHWDQILRNVWYSIIAGVALILLVAIYDALRATLREKLE